MVSAVEAEDKERSASASGNEDQDRGPSRGRSKSRELSIGRRSRSRSRSAASSGAEEADFAGDEDVQDCEEDKEPENKPEKDPNDGKNAGEGHESNGNANNNGNNSSNSGAGGEAKEGQGPTLVEQASAQADLVLKALVQAEAAGLLNAEQAETLRRAAEQVVNSVKIAQSGEGDAGSPTQAAASPLPAKEGLPSPEDDPLGVASASLGDALEPGNALAVRPAGQGSPGKGSPGTSFKGGRPYGKGSPAVGAGIIGGGQMLSKGGKGLGGARVGGQPFVLQSTASIFSSLLAASSALAPLLSKGKGGKGGPVGSAGGKLGALLPRDGLRPETAAAAFTATKSMTAATTAAAPLTATATRATTTAATLTTQAATATTAMPCRRSEQSRCRRPGGPCVIGSWV